MVGAWYGSVQTHIQLDLVKECLRHHLRWWRSMAPNKKQHFFSSYVAISVTRLGDLWKFLVTKCVTKVAQLFGLFCKTSLLCENCFGYFLAIFGKIWATFNSNIWSHWLRWSPMVEFIWCRQLVLWRWVFKQKICVRLGGSACGTVGRSVAADTRGHGFKSAIMIMNI